MGQVMYVECRSGAAGDMLLAALIDLGLPVAELEDALGSLQLDHRVVVSRVVRAGIAATKLDVEPRHGDVRQPDAHPHPHAPGLMSEDGHRSLDEIARLIQQSSLSERGRARAIALFHRLGEVEAAIHGVTLDRVHLHEVGAIDSIIDIVGLVFGLEWFGIEDIVVSPLNVGGGTVQIAHGRFPVPAPATLRLLEKAPIYNGGPDVELVTPTGALILSDYATAFGPMPALIPRRVGYGAGTRDFPSAPNVVRIVIGDRPSAEAATSARVTKVECEIDDMNPQLFGPAIDRLFNAGALDVFLTAIQMKKGRPGTLVTVLVPDERRPAICEVLFRETTTIGVRFETMEREVLAREWAVVHTKGGAVRIKVARRDGTVVNAVPEFGDCLRIAEATGRPVKEVQAEASSLWRGRRAIE
jgi:uncharacterized protein (TIGR00299 family) protein